MISILRLDHRIHRDARVTTHLALTSRAFLAGKLYYTGQKDTKFEDSIKNINKKWGSNFELEYIKNYRNLLKETNSLKIHLTIYGIPFLEKIKEIKNSKKDLLIIVGGQKVPRDVYELVDLNISVTSQPISEITALSILLNELLDKKALNHNFENAKIKVIPQVKSKKLQKA